MSKLSAIQVRNLKPRSKPYTIADGGGLFTHITPSGVISWRYRYRFNGEATTQVLGKFPEMSLAEARVAHQKSKATFREGVNTLSLRKKCRELEARKKEIAEIEKSKNTLQTVAKEWISNQGERWSHDHTKLPLKCFNVSELSVVTHCKQVLPCIIQQ